MKFFNRQFGWSFSGLQIVGHSCSIGEFRVASESWTRPLDVGVSTRRGDGFSKHPGEETSLSMKITFIENLKNRVILYKKELSVFFTAIIFFTFLYLIL